MASLDADARFILSDDVQIVPFGDLSEEDRIRTGCAPDDSVISRRGSRGPARIVNSSVVDVLQMFAVPATIPEVLQTFARRRGISAREVLDHVYPVLSTLAAARVLVPSECRTVGDHVLASGTEVAGFVCEECIQCMDDTEVHRAVAKDGGCVVALKLSRDISYDDRIRHEARVMASLSVDCIPSLVASGVHGERAYCAGEWRPGVVASVVADGIRRMGSWNGLSLEHLATAIAGAYSTLHRAGVVHGDVHPGNVLVAKAEVTLIDLAFARRLGDTLAPCRAGVGFFFEPEYARALLENECAPPATVLGEQYSLAAMLWWLVTGDHYLAFSYGRDAQLQQVATQRPRSFRESGLDGHSALEAILRLALAKDPRDRFPSIADLAGAFDDLATRSSSGCTRPREDDGQGWVRAVIDSFQSADRISLTADDDASMVTGSTGIAYAYSVLATVEDNPDFLAAADYWIHRGRAMVKDVGAAEEIAVRGRSVPAWSLFHGTGGVHFVSAVIGHLLGDQVQQTESILQYLECCELAVGSESTELFFGSAGLLLGLCVFVRLGIAEDGIDDAGTRLAAVLASDPQPEAGAMLGMAHGLGGILYSQLAWCRVKDQPAPESLSDRLNHFLAFANNRSGMLCFPVRVDRPGEGGVC